MHCIFKIEHTFCIVEPQDGKIVFKKPTKKDPASSDLIVSSKSNKDTEKVMKIKKLSSKSKQIKNTKLLSFNEDEEDET